MDSVYSLKTIAFSFVDSSNLTIWLPLTVSIPGIGRERWSMNNDQPNKPKNRTPNRGHLKRQILAFIGATAALVFSANGQSPIAEAQYSLVDLGVLPGKAETVPAALNNFGLVAGTASAGTLVETAFRYNSNPGDQKPLQDIGRSKDGAISRGFGINEVGQIVGDSSFGLSEARIPVTHAALFSNGNVQDLGFLKAGGNFSRANDINASGQVVGFSSSTRDGEKSRAFLWTAATGMIDIGTLGGAFAQAYAINDAGFITGAAETGDSSARETHGFLSQPISIGRQHLPPGRLLSDQELSAVLPLAHTS